MPNILTQKGLRRLVDRIKRELYESIGIRIEIPFEVKLSMFGSPKLMYDRRNKVLRLQISRFEGLRKGRLETLLKYFMLKVLAYRTFCPGSEVRASQIIIQAIKNSDYLAGILASTILIEILTDFYISHIDFESLLRGLRCLEKKFFGFGKLASSVMHAYNLMLGEDIFPRIGEKSKKIGEKIYEIIFTRNIMDPSIWPIIASELAKYLMSSEGRIEGAMRRLSFTYDILDEFIPALAVQIGKGEQAITRVIRIFYEKFGGSISSTAPALLSTVGASPRDILRLWYRERARELVKVIIGSTHIERSQKIGYPTTWEMGDPIEKLDVFLSTSISPIMVPGYTTKKWEVAETSPQIIHRIAPDILIVIDSSGSMGRLPGDIILESSDEQKTISKKLGITYALGSKFDIALTAAFGIVECALNMGSSIGVVNFSDKGYVCEFTREREKIEDILMIHQNGGTYLPVRKILDILRGRESILIIVLSDAAIYNQKEAEQLLRHLSKTHTLYFLHIEAREGYSILENIKYEGARVIRIKSLEELPTKVLRIIAKHLEYSHEMF